MIVIQIPVMPRTEVARSTPSKPERQGEVLPDICYGRTRNAERRGNVGHPVAQDGRIGGFKRHLRARPHRHSDACLLQG